MVDNMKNDIITIYTNNQRKDYHLLMILDKEYKYVIYTDIENKDLDKNLYVAKVKSIDKLDETMPISDDEWSMIEEEYHKILSARD